MNYLVRRNPYAHHSHSVGTFSPYDIYEDLTGRSASKDLESVKRGATTAIQGELQKLAAQLQARVQHFAEVEATSLVNTLINEIPNEREMSALGDAIGIEIRNAIRDNVLPSIYKRVDEAVASTQGLGFVSSGKRLEIYTKIKSVLPQTKTLDVQGIKLTVNVGAIFEKALPFDKFSRIFDRVDPLISSVRYQAETAAIETGRNVGLFIAINSFVLGGLVTYGFIKLYNSVK